MFGWIGSPQRHVEGRANYGSCQIEDGASVSIGDYVHMLPADLSHELYIARIKDLFETEGEKCVEVLWLYRQTDLKHSPPCAPEENEVYHTNYYDCQLIQSIVGPCHVVQYTNRPTKPLTRTRKEQEVSTDVYVCRYSYSEETGEFVEALLSDFDHCLITKDHKEEAENVNADVKDLVDILLELEQNLPLQTAIAAWPAGRMAWLKKVKAITCLEEVKQALMDLEDEFHIFTNEPSWREQVFSCRSSDMLLCYIKSLIQNMQANANISEHQKLEVTFLGKGTPRDSYRKAHKRKRATSAPVNPHILKKQASESSLCRGIYKIEQGNLPPDAPPHLKNLRVALVCDTKKDYVTIAYPSMASLAECFGKFDTCIEDGSQERKLTRCLFNQTSMSTCTMPRFDEEFKMTAQTAQTFLTCLISSPKYLKQGHLQSFWLRSGEYTNSRMRETQANKNNSCCSGKVISSCLDPREPRPDDTNSVQLADIYTLQKAEGGERKYLSVDNEDGEVSESKNKLSEDESCSHQIERNDSTEQTNMVMPLNISDCGNALSSQQIHDTRAKCAGVEEFTHKSQVNGISEEDQGIVRWGIRKKITHQNRCRGNAYNSDDLINKVLSYKDRVPKGQLHAVASSSINADKHLTVTCITTNLGKGKMLKVPKEMQGRWSSERYKAAQLKLFQIMKEKGAVPGKPLLRPALREEARKHIGDTGLLDHLLKHMTDTVINNGERFRRRHNSDGAMEYWLEDARLQEMRKQAGVDQYWIPPPGWKFGDAIANNTNEGLSQSQLNELRLLRQDVEKLKSQLRYVCLHLGTSFVESKNTLVLGRDSGFQPWKKDQCMTEQAQDRTVKYTEYPVELNCLEETNEANPNNIVPPQKDAHGAFITTEYLPADGMEDMAMKDKAHRQELCEMSKKSTKGAMDNSEKNSGDELLLFHKAARPCLKTSPKANMSRGSAEKRSPGSIVLRRSPRSRAKEVGDNKENIVSENHQSELMKPCKSPKPCHRQVLSAKSLNVQLCSVASCRQSKVSRLKPGPFSSR